MASSCSDEYIESQQWSKHLNIISGDGSVSNPGGASIDGDSISLLSTFLGTVTWFIRWAQAPDRLLLCYGMGLRSRHVQTIIAIPINIDCTWKGLKFKATVVCRTHRRFNRHPVVNHRVRSRFLEIRIWYMVLILHGFATSHNCLY